MAELMSIPLNSNELKQALQSIYKIRRAAMVWGPPGVGKSRVMKQLAKELGIPLKDIRALLMNPVDVNGLPHIVHKTAALEQLEAILTAPGDIGADRTQKIADILHSTSEVDLYGTTIWSRPGFMPNGPCLMLFDELNSAPAAVQAALYQVMLDFQIGDHKLVDGCVPFAAGNRMTDRGHTVRMPLPLSDRMFHYDFMVEWEPWVQWAVDNGVHPLIIAYLKFSLRDHGAGLVDVSAMLKEKLTELITQPVVSLGSVQTIMKQIADEQGGDDAPVGMLHRFNPKSGERSFPTPRSWEFVSDVIYQFEEDGLTGTLIEEATVAGKVGPTAARELAAFAITFRQNFTIDAVIRNPDTTNVPDEPSMRCAVAGALARYASPVNINQIGIYMDRLPEEYQVMFVKTATARDPALNATHWVTKFDVQKADIMR